MAVQQDEDNVGEAALPALLTLGGGIMTIVEAALLYTDAVHGPRPL